MSNDLEGKMQQLKRYFDRNKAVELAFLFGSRSKGSANVHSDWDIGVYLTPHEFAEIETSSTYEKEVSIWSDLVEILGTDNIDVVVLNRAAPKVVYSALREGIPLKKTNLKLYFRLLNKTSYEAMDFWQTVSQYRYIFENAQSLTLEAKSELEQVLVFLQSQLTDLPQFQAYTFEDYANNRDKQRNLERWVENIVMASLDIAKVVLASEKRQIPQTYKEILSTFVAGYGEKELVDEFGRFAELRNIVAHEYLDIRWSRIEKFIQRGEVLYPKFLMWVKGFLVSQ